MHLSGLSIEGYKGFGEAFEIRFAPGLTVLVGENGSGKSAIVDAIRLLLSEEERVSIKDTDFFRPFSPEAQPASCIRLVARFDKLSREEQVAFLPWTFDDNASLTLLVDGQDTKSGRFKKVLWGGRSKASAFEPELFDKISCVYLPPLRDAEAKLREGRGSHLARLLRNLNRKRTELTPPEAHPLEVAVKEFNEKLAGDDSQIICSANKLISEQLKAALGEVFGQDTWIQFSEVSFNRIVEGLRLLFFPQVDASDKRELFRSLAENSLGYNNLLYLGTILAQLTEVHQGPEYLQVLVIEEPEAHLHPQLQTRLLRYLEQQAGRTRMQVIVTTHSPVVASAARLDTVIHLSKDHDGKTQAIALRECGLPDRMKAFLTRWLDVTKSTLLFAKGILLVEGIGEALLLPELAQLVLAEYNDRLVNDESGRGEAPRARGGGRLPSSLQDAGVSIINMNGIYFRYFMQLFANLEGGEFCSIPVRCAGITDRDPKSRHTGAAEQAGSTNPALALIAILEQSVSARLYCGKYKTFEYDLAMESANLNLMLPVALEVCETDGPVKQRFKNDAAVDWSQKQELEKQDAAQFLLDHIEKGVFAQALAARLQQPIKDPIPLQVPEYIKRGVIWACGGFA